ncbi:MAG: B12-binding domain-containing radical SAM protein [Anaerolineae bacterium]
MLKVLFANPFFLADSALERKFMTLYFPLGLLYLAGVAREAGHSVAVFDGTFALGDGAYVDALAEHDPDVVCIASLVTLRRAALRLARLADNHGAIVIVGGPDPSAEPEAYLSEPAVDVVVVGEGERTLIDLLATLEVGGYLARVRGIAYRSDDGTVTKTQDREPILDLDVLSWPARDLIEVNRYLTVWKTSHGYSSLSLSASRGCPYGCEYCTEAVMGPHLRRRSPASVAAEMRHLEMQHAPDRFRLVDDLEGLGRDWLLALGRAMIAAGVTTPYEGLKPIDLGDLPMLTPAKDICAERNMWIPTQAPHAHAPPALDPQALHRRWQEGQLLEGEHLEDP